MVQPQTLGRSVEQTQEWLTALAGLPDIGDETRALKALRGVLTQLRDRMSAGEAAGLASQLPTLIRGIYYDGYSPDHPPQNFRKQEEFICGVAQRIGEEAIDARAATEAVFSLLTKQIADGEIGDLVHMMPREIKTLWPAKAQIEAARKHHH